MAFADHRDASLYLSNPFLNDVVDLPSLATLPQVLGVERDPNGTLYFKVPSDESYHVWGGGDVDPTLKYDPDSMVRSMISSIALSLTRTREIISVMPWLSKVGGDNLLIATLVRNMMSLIIILLMFGCGLACKKTVMGMAVIRLCIVIRVNYGML